MDSDRYEFANCTQTQPAFHGFLRLARGKVISVTVPYVFPALRVRFSVPGHGATADRCRWREASMFLHCESNAA